MPRTPVPHRLTRRIDQTLPPGLGAEEQLQARLGVAMATVVGLTLIAFSPAFALYAELPGVGVGCAVTGLASLALARLWGRLGHLVALQAFLVLCFALETFAVMTQGGAASPFLAFVLYPVLYAGLLGTPRMTLGWGVFAVAYAAAFQLVPEGWDLGQAPDPGPFWLIAVTPMVGIAGGIVAYVSESNRRERHEAHEARERAESAHEEAERARAEAERASRAKSDFLAIASHELRSPLAGILGAAELLQRDPEDVGRLAEIIARSGERMAALVDDLLDFKRIERGELRLTSEVFDPRQLLRDLVDLHAQTDEGTTVVLAFHPDLPAAVEGDAGRIRQVVTNLVSNALKFSAGGEVTITARGALRIDVEDQGPGIDPELRTAIFDPFVRADTGPDRNASGTGLGLAVSRGLAEAMGGTLDLVDSDRGAHFRLALSLAPATLPAAPDPQPHVAPLEVLVVDDDPMTRLVTARMVAFAGHHPIETASGPEALAACRRALPDAVLLDWHMPGMDGFVTAEHLRAHWPELCILGYTASTAPEEAERATRVGMNAILRKPVGLDALQRALVEACPAAKRTDIA